MIDIDSMRNYLDFYRYPPCEYYLLILEKFVDFEISNVNTSSILCFKNYYENLLFFTLSISNYKSFSSP